MFKVETLFYKKKDTIIHRLDPRVKLFYAISMFILALLRTDLLYLAFLFFLSLSLIFIAKIFKELLFSLRIVVVFSILIFLFNYIFTLNFELAFAMVFRLLIFINSFFLFSLTTSTEDFALALLKLRFPYEFVLIFTLAVRFIPTLMSDAINIIDSQKSRGLEFQKGNFIKRIKNYIPIIVPLLVVAIKRAINVADAMESRCFGATKKPVSLYELNFKIIDYAVLIILTLSLLLISIYTFF